MKKLILVALLLCLLLGACNGNANVSSADSSILPQTAGTSPAPAAEVKSEPSPEPTIEPSSEAESESAPEPEAEPESVPEPEAEPYDYYPVLERLEMLVVGNGYEEGVNFLLGNEDREALWQLMRVDDWEVATDLPAMGFSSVFYLYEPEQTWFFNSYESQTLIVPWASPPDDEKVCYFAPSDIMDDILAYAETLTPQQAKE